jgi:hypothetical protein
MTTQDMNVILLLMIYSVVTHWEPLMAGINMLMEDFREV